MSIPAVARPKAQGPARTAEIVPPVRRSGRPLLVPRRMVAVILLFGIVAGSLGGSFAYLASRKDPVARGRAADSARWAAQAEAWLPTIKAKEALERGRRADADRWAAQAEEWAAAERGLTVGQFADGARWAAQAKAWLAAQKASGDRP